MEYLSVKLKYFKRSRMGLRDEMLTGDDLLFKSLPCKRS